MVHSNITEQVIIMKVLDKHSQMYTSTTHRGLLTEVG